MNFKYAILDLDGTLLESMKVWRDCDIEEIQVFLGSPLTKQQISEYEVLPFIEMVKKHKHKPAESLMFKVPFREYTRG